MEQFIAVSLPQSGPNDVTATVGEWSKTAGQWVNKGEVLGSAETTKSVFDLEAPAAGQFWPLAAVGSEAAVGSIVAALSHEEASSEAAAAWLAVQGTAAAGSGPVAAAEPAALGADQRMTAAQTQEPKLRTWTLKAELLSQQHGIDLAHVPAAGEKITEADVRAYLARQAAEAAEPAAVRLREGTQGGGTRKNKIPGDAAPGDAAQGKAAQGKAAQGKAALAESSPLVDLVDDRYAAVRPQRILIIGGGNGAVQILDALALLPRQRAVGILDDNGAIHGKRIAGVPVLGAIDLGRAAEMAAAGEFDAAVISISTNIAVRARIFEQWKSRGIAFANVIHPSSVIGMNVAWGEGNVVMALCHFGACAAVGDNNFLSAFCSIEHHCVLGSHCSFGPSVVTSSRVQIGDRVRFGTGIVIEPGIRIGADSTIASGLAITQHIPERSLLKAHVGYSLRSKPML